MTPNRAEDGDKDEVEDALATFEELAQLELEFDDVDTLMVAHQYLISKPIYARRAATIKKIRNFWALAFEMAPPEIDSLIQPTDSEVMAMALDDFSVDRFEVPPDAPAASTRLADFGTPRSVSFRFEFGLNEWFEAGVLEKKFYWRRAADGFAGLVSEPVRIPWKPGKDLTHGLLDAACALAAAVEKAGPGATVADLDESRDLSRRVAKTTEGSRSFFAWFGYIGRFVGAEESARACKEFEDKRARARAEGRSADADEEGEIDVLENDIFPAGEGLATELADNFWPGALSFFTSAQEDISERDFEEAASEEEEDEDEQAGRLPDIRGLVNGPPAKRRKT